MNIHQSNKTIASASTLNHRQILLSKIIQYGSHLVRCNIELVDVNILLVLVPIRWLDFKKNDFALMMTLFLRSLHDDFFEEDWKQICYQNSQYPRIAYVVM